MKFAPVAARYLQVWMTQSSNTCDTHGSRDVRNCVGYAIHEIYAGTRNATGIFVDEVKHSTVARGDGAQTATWCSSVDPWHSESDALVNGGRHTGLDLFFTSGITNNLPAMIPVTLLYGTPEDAAAEIRYLEKRGYPIGYVEMGEEPDGQRMLPDDYAAFYVQWARAIHQVDPSPQARRAGVRGHQRGTPGLARREGPHLLDGALRRLSAGPPSTGGPQLLFAGTLSRSAEIWTGQLFIASLT